LFSDLKEPSFSFLGPLSLEIIRSGRRPILLSTIQLLLLSIAE
jgi:hypothetical protein